MRDITLKEVQDTMLFPNSSIDAFLAQQPQQPVVVVLGPTASGKTALAIRIAQQYDGEIINADSRQIYRGLIIGAASPTAEEQAAAVHHLVGSADPATAVSVWQYRAWVQEKRAEIRARGHLPIIAGGHTLLISSLVENYIFPERGTSAQIREELEREYALPEGPARLHARLAARDSAWADKIPPQNKHHLIRALELGDMLHTKERRDAEQDFLLLGIAVPREVLYTKINARVEMMLAAGLLDEVRDLAQKYPRFAPALRGHGYREVLDYLAGEKSLEQAIGEIQQDTRNYAKRQMSWWRNCKYAEKILWGTP